MFAFDQIRRNVGAVAGAGRWGFRGRLLGRIWQGQKTRKPDAPHHLRLLDHAKFWLLYRAPAGRHFDDKGVRYRVFGACLRKVCAMSLEIERKFLVSNDNWRASVIDAESIRDGLISERDGTKVRVRLGRDGAWLAVKSDRSGPSRLEFEYEIPRFDAEEMLARICDHNIFVKDRHKVVHAGSIWVVDVYAAHLAGIVLAEIELQSEDQHFELPDWVGQEVTYNPRFHKRHIGHLCREAGRPLSIVELLNGSPEGAVYTAM